MEYFYNVKFYKLVKVVTKPLPIKKPVTLPMNWVQIHVELVIRIQTGLNTYFTPIHHE